MKYLKTFEKFTEEFEKDVTTNESLRSALKKFVSFITFDRQSDSDDPMDKMKVVNPDTKKKIKIKSALKKDDDSPVKKVADAIVDEYKKDDKDAEEKKEIERIKKAISDKFNSRIEKEKKDKEGYAPGEEWTEKDSIELRTTIMMDMVRETKDPKDKRRIERMFLNDPSISPGWINQASKVFSNESIDEYIDNLGKEKLDEIMDSDQGQEYAEMVLRSKKATPEQRKKALMNQWVMSSKAPGAIMMQEYMVDRLKMGGKSRDGLKFRKKSKNDFESREYGGLRDDVKEANLKVIEEIYKETQEYYKKKGIKEVTLYRGYDKGNDYENPMTSWTTDPSVAKEYGSKVITKKVPVEQIMMGSFDPTFPDPVAMDTANPDGTPKRSKEIVVLGT